jgi:hypothetical protein
MISGLNWGMSKQDRLSIDLKGLRERIETHSSDPAWKALSLAKKIRLLIETALDQGESAKSQNSTSMEYKSLKQLILRNWDKLADAPIPLSRLQAMRDGEAPTQDDINQLSQYLNLPVETIQKISDKGMQPNGA